MTPNEIAKDAATSILVKYATPPDSAYEWEEYRIATTALILTAAAKMVRESGAIEALDSAQLGCRLDQRILLQNREKLAAQCDAALEKLRSISGEEAGKSPGDPGS